MRMTRNKFPRRRVADAIVGVAVKVVVRREPGGPW
jgi:hypothetical protein